MKVLKYSLLITLFVSFSFSHAQKWKNHYDTSIELYESGNADSSLYHTNLALEIIKKDRGENDTLYVKVLNLHNDLLYEKGDFTKCYDLSIKEESIRTNLGRTKDIDYAKNVYRLAMIYSKKGNQEKAEENYSKTLEIYEVTEKELPKDMLNLYISISAHFTRFKKHEEALFYLEKADALAIKQFGKKHMEYTKILSKFGHYYFRTKNYRKSKQYYEKARDILKNLAGEKSKSYIDALQKIAEMNSYLGENELSLSQWFVIRKLRKETLGVKSIYYGLCLDQIGRIYLKIGNFEGALENFKESREIFGAAFGKEHRYYATQVGNVALVYNYLGEYEKALELENKVLEIREKVRGKNTDSYSINLHNLAAIYKNMKQYDKAIENYQKSLGISEDKNGKTTTEYGIKLRSLGNVYVSMKKYDLAEDLYNEAINIHKKNVGEYDLTMLRGYSSLAYLYYMKKDLNKAFKYNQKSLEIANFNIEKGISHYSEKSVGGFLNRTRDVYNLLYRLNTRFPEESSQLRGDVYNSILLKKNLLLRSSTSLRRKIQLSEDSTIIQKYDSWIDLRKKITNLYSDVNKNQNLIDSLELVSSEIENSLVLKSRDFENEKKNVRFDWKQIQKGLDKKEMAVEFFHFQYGEDSVRYCALLLNSKMKQPKLVHLFWEDELKSFIENTTGPDHERIAKMYQKSGKLYELIWKPIEADLKGYKKIYYSPSGILHRISFAALETEQSKLLSEKFELVFVSTTASALSENDFKINLKGEATLFGGVQYSGDSDEDEIWSYLPGTKVETDNISTMLKKQGMTVNYLTNKEATEEEFKKLASQSDILHLSTHGFFFPDPAEIRKLYKEEKQDTVIFRGSSKAGKRGIANAIIVKNSNPLMRSGLTFAGANKVWNVEEGIEGEDGILTAKEVSNLNLANTDLVVLSACETGLGDIRGSQGVYGLQRSFKIAGVQYIIMSLWQVPDNETQEFMTSFYTNLTNGMGIYKAFRTTQNMMMEKYDPYFWAAFVLIE